jgi:hypothetical protein
MFIPDPDTTILKTSIPSHGIDVSKNQFHNGIDFSQKTIPWNQCCGSGMFIPDPGSEFFHLGSRIKKIPDPGSGSSSKNINIFNNKNCF